MTKKKDVPISYHKSFLAKYIQSDDRVKQVYGIIKNKLLSISGTKSRISWFYDAINIGRINFAKISVRGKYLSLYLNLDCAAYPENIYHQVYVGEKRRFGDTSFKIHVKSDRTIKYALRLIDDEINKFNLKTNLIPKENYFLDYENDAPLIKRGLIKVITAKYTYSPEEYTRVDSFEEDHLFDEGNMNTQVIFVDGSKVFVQQRKSFTAKLIQSDENTQNYYSIIKNQLLSFTKIKSRISWKYESFTQGRSKLAKMQIRGRYLVVFLSLDYKKYAKNKNIENAEKNPLFKYTPVAIRVKDEERLNLCLDLIQDLKKRFLLEEGFIKEDHPFRYDFESTENLIDKGLVKVYAKFGDYNSPCERIIGEEIESKKNNNFPVYKEEEQLILSVNEKNNNFEEKIVINKVPLEGERDIVYLDEIDKNYDQGEIVDIDSLKKKGILTTDIKFYKVVYRGGSFDKKMVIKASAISPIAEKIINQASGKYINEIKE